MALLLVIVLAGPISMFSAENTNPAMKPLKRDVQRHKQFLKLTKPGNPDVVFLGDSITQAWENAGREAWAKNFAPLKAMNFGISGDRTGHVLWRLTEGGEFANIKPKLVVLMIGTNNVPTHKPEDIAGAIAEITKTIHAKSTDTRIVLLAVFPRAIDSTGTVDNKIAEINKIIAKLHDGKKITYLDIGDKFLVNGKVSRGIMPDFLHLSPRGYEIWATAIAPVVRKMLTEPE